MAPGLARVLQQPHELDAFWRLGDIEVDLTQAITIFRRFWHS
jgi:hypothetical protein